jgi:hypothetical protein
VTSSILGHWKLKERGNVCDKVRRILHGASVNYSRIYAAEGHNYGIYNPEECSLHSHHCVNLKSNTICNETNYWTEEEIQRTSHDVHILRVKTWSG